MLLLIPGCGFSVETNVEQMLDLQEKIESEVHNAHDEYLKMEAHIKLYITEMEQALT